jgi:hypothetical protein
MCFEATKGRSGAGKGRAGRKGKGGTSSTRGLGKTSEELRTALPDEQAGCGGAIKTVAVAVEQSCQRRFAPDVTISSADWWMTFRRERETVILTTMNGQSTFSWDSNKLSKKLAWDDW